MTVKRVALLSIGINLLFILFLAGKRIYYTRHAPAESLSYADLLNKAKSETFAGMSIDTSDIVFIGDSQTERFPADELFGNLHLKNRGIGQNTSHHLIGRLPGILSARPKKIFLQIGINDLANGVSTDSLFKNFVTIIKMVKGKSSGTQLYIESIFPTSSFGSDFKYMPAIQKENEILKDYCKSEGVGYIDIYPALLKDGELDKIFTVDGLHLNYEGNLVWKHKICTLVN